MAGEQYGTDMAVSADGELVTPPTGDVAIVSGEACLVQSLRLRLATPRGDLHGHPNYGCDIFAWLHGDDTPARRAGAEQEIESALEEDPRVLRATADAVSLESDAVQFRIEVQPIDAAHPLNLVLGYGIDEVTLDVV